MLILQSDEDQRRGQEAEEGLTRSLPAKGVYAMVLRVSRETLIVVGRLGRREFRAGYYVYTGSGLNSLPSRVSRHLKRSKKKHWHIDYLTTSPSVRVLGLAWRKTDRRLECEASRRMNVDADGSVVGFGCGDCKCASHLYYFHDPRRVRDSLMLARLQNWVNT
jgi:Uri superfamily endonuclease